MDIKKIFVDVKLYKNNTHIRMEKEKNYKALMSWKKRYIDCDDILKRNIVQYLTKEKKIQNKDGEFYYHLYQWPPLGFYISSIKSVWKRACVSESQIVAILWKSDS